MRVIIGEPPAKDMGCNPAAAGCGDSRKDGAHKDGDCSESAVSRGIRKKPHVQRR